MITILRLGARSVAVIAFLAFASGCSNWVLGVVQSFGSPNGPKISTIAGNGTGGYTGDGGPATGAELKQPYAVAVDSGGNLYIADGVNNVIRKVTASGTITTVVPSSAGLNSPEGVAVDSSGDIYVSDSGNQVIKEFPGVPPNIVVGGGVTPPFILSYPSGIAVDSNGYLYISDMGNSRILKLQSGTVSTVAGIAGIPGYSGDGGLATGAHLNNPTAVAVDASGNIYIADGLNFVIRKIDKASGNIYTVAGNGVNGDSGDGGPALSAELSQPYGVAVDSFGNLYISELNSVVRKVDTSGNISTVAGNVHLGAGYGGDGNVATAAVLDEPWGLAIDLSGNLLIADRLNNRIRKVALGQ